jgi:hypothetical protein
VLDVPGSSTSSIETCGDIAAEGGRLISGCTEASDRGRLSTSSGLNNEATGVGGVGAEAGSGVTTDCALSFGVETDEGPDFLADISIESGFITDFKSFVLGKVPNGSIFLTVPCLA